MGLLCTRAMGGLLLGSWARVWMRLVADEPEFTWTGSMVVVGSFGLFGLASGVAQVSSSSGTVARRIGKGGAVLLSLPLFGAAGSLMLPTVFLGSLAAHRQHWWKPIRCVCGVLAAVAPVVLTVQVLHEHVSVGRVIGVLMFLATYALVVRLAASIATRGSDPRLRTEFP